MTEARARRVLLLIGPSSLGKTAVAEVLQRRLPGFWLLAGVDMFWGMLDETRLPIGAFRTESEEMRRITHGWQRALAALAREGNAVLVDERWTHRWWLEDLREVLKDIRWWSVLLTANDRVVAERETRRGDRPTGPAAEDVVQRPDPALIDLVIDTTHMIVADCAAAIMHLIARDGDSE